MKRGHLWMTVGVVGALGAIAIGWVLWSVRPRSIEYWTDGASVREQGEVVRVRDVLWTPAVRMGDGVNTAGDEYEPRVSADGRTLWFVRGRAGGDAELWVSERTRDGWGDATLFAPTSSPADELGPCPSADGEAVYFYSDREGGLGGYDLWVVRRGENGWGVAQNLGPGVNSALNDYGPALSPDGERLYFASNRPAPGESEGLPDEDAWPATIREDLFSRHYDVYEAAVGDHGFGPAALVEALSSPANDGAPAVSPVGDFVYFSSDRDGGEGGFDLYRARLLDGAFRDVENLGAPVNTPANELDPSPAMEGFALHFSSDRDAGAVAHGYDVYRSVSREVFREVEVVSAEFGWGVVWGTLWPWLLALLLALVLLALLARLANDERWRARWRALSLMTQCVMLSLLAHLLLMTLFAAWKVTTSLEGLMRAGGGQKVALTTSAGGGDIASQVRGGLADVSFEAAAPSELARPAVDQAWEAPAQVDAGAPAAERVERVVEHEWTDPGESSPIAGAEAPVEAPTLEASVGALAASLPEAAREAARGERSVEVSPRPLASGAAPPRLGSDGGAVRTVDAGVESLETVVERSPVARAVLPDESAAGAAAPANVGAPALSGAEGVVAVATPSAGAAPAMGGEASLDTDAGVAAGAAPVAPAIEVATGGRSELYAGGVEALPGVAVAREGTAGARFDAPEAQGGRVRPVATGGAPVAPLPGGGTLDLALPGARHAQAQAEPVGEGDAAPFAPGALTGSAPSPDLPLGGATIGEDAAIEAPLDFVTPTPERVIASEAIEAETPIAALAPDLPPGGLPAIGLPDFDLALPVAAGDGEDAEPELRLSGVVIDGATGRGLAGALVRIDLSEGQGAEATTDPEGGFFVAPESAPEHVAVSASKPGYQPAAVNVSRLELERGAEVVLLLLPNSSSVIALEEEPDVHHLGNDEFTGRVNSQFQKKSEGTAYRVTFRVDASQVAPAMAHAEVRLLARGAQIPNQVRINGRLVPRRLDNSPGDGSFGEFTAAFPIEWLGVGENVFEIRSVKQARTDFDDFEFINVRIVVEAADGEAF